jgi:hypothetical protein
MAEGVSSLRKGWARAAPSLTLVVAVVAVATVVVAAAVVAAVVVVVVVVVVVAAAIAEGTAKTATGIRRRYTILVIRLQR